MPDVRWRWSPVQSQALLSTEPFLDIEGGIRAGKTTVANAKVQITVSEQPGVRGLLARWKEDDLFAELVPKWRDFARQCGLTLRWHADEGYDEVVETGAKVYLRGLRSSDNVSRFGSLRGLDLSFFHVEQAEEMPEDYWPELVGRLSQKGYPHWGWLTAQPVNQDHWIARTWPEDNSRLADGYRYVRMNVYDNVQHVGESYVRQLESNYPLGSAQRRTLLEGRRGLAIQGEPVYGGYFNRRVHVRDVEMNPQVPLMELWDFGHGHPCVVFAQWLPIGRFQILGAVMGHNVFLEDFAPVAMGYRQEWFKQPLEVWSVGDPSGLEANNQGVRETKVRDILAQHGSFPTSQTHANRPEVRYQAIQTVSGLMRRMALDGEPSFACSPRGIYLARGSDGRVTPTPSSFMADGFEAGYVWDSRQLIGVSSNIRRPKKDGYYDHGMNGVEYGALAFLGNAMPTQADVAKAERRSVRLAQTDYDPDVPSRRHRRMSVGRGGY